jgi:hypothetical protein
MRKVFFLRNIYSGCKAYPNLFGIKGFVVVVVVVFTVAAKSWAGIKLSTFG